MKQLLLLALFLCSFVTQAQPLPGNEYVRFSVQILEDQGQYYLALNYHNEPQWHTYWKNPGDAGIPYKNSFLLNKKPFNPTPLEWPAPKRFIEAGDILTYGYSKGHSLFYQLNEEQKEQVLAGELQATSRWLVCKDICIHGEKTRTLNQKTEAPELSIKREKLGERRQKIPQKSAIPKELEIFLNRGPQENTLYLYYSLTGVRPQKLIKDSNVLTPFPTLPFNFKREQLYYDKQQQTLYGAFLVEWDGEYQEPPIPLPQDGVFARPYTLEFLFANPSTQQVEHIQWEAKQFALTTAQTVEATLKRFGPLNDLESASSAESIPLWQILLLAFLGGLILNLMPCVLPVISLKLFGMIQQRSSQAREVLRHHLLYTLGILLSFWLLAVVIIALKSTGESIGWGFQLQSPSFVLLMTMAIFIFALNLFGLFEFVTPGGKQLGNVEAKGHFWGPIVSGVLATALSTPCSAPFLGTALTFAFTTGTGSIFFIFTFVALGLASPFLLIGFFPRLAGFLPRPGQWMNTLKYFLGLTLLLTGLWLLSIFGTLLNSAYALIVALLLLTFIFFTIFLLQKVATRSWAKLLCWLLLFSCLIAPLFIDFPQEKHHTSQTSSSQWQTWSPEKMNSYKGKSVFVDFTADWCLTCKVNKKLVLDTEDFYQFAQENELVLMQADWTKRDAIIGNWLARYQVVGIPAYFLQTKDGSIHYLGETITIEKIRRHL